MKNTLGQKDTAGGRGFSLVELLIAMVVTLIVCGAVMSLLMQGNQAFQIQPDMTERQQNIRAAMDLIMRDVANAGGGLPLGAQVFKPGLNSPTGGFVAPSGVIADELQMLTNDAGLDPVTSPSTPAFTSSSSSITVQSSATQFLAGMPVAVTMTDGTFTLRRVTVVSTPAATTVTTLTLDTGSSASSGADVVCKESGTSTGGTPTGVVYQDVVHYRIFSVTEDPAQPAIPVLERQSSAGGCAGRWEIVARGIEDMRVTYRKASAITTTPGNGQAETCTTPDAWGACPLPDDVPFTMTTGMPQDQQVDALTVEVQVELAARGGLYVAAGGQPSRPMMTKGADGSYAFRGRLVSRGTPRAALSLLGTFDTPTTTPPLKRWY